MKWPWQKNVKRVYLDYAAATPLLPEAKAAMEPFLSDVFGNPSAIHAEGVAAKAAMEAARAKLARLLRIREPGIVFTGSGTESNNLALWGIIEEAHRQGRATEDIEIITTPLEHPSISNVMQVVRAAGMTVHTLRVDNSGLIDLAHLEQLLSPKTLLVTLGYANSEIGVVQDIKRITRLVRKCNATHRCAIRVHLDAAQAPYWLPCQLEVLGVDLMTLDVGKCGGPKGVGVLAFRHGVELAPIILGGGQEHGLRAGTENVAGIVGAVTAFEIAQRDWESRSAATAALRDSTIDRLLQIEGAVLNGSREKRIANNINISIPGVDTEYATIVLDHHGIAVSTKSACSGAGGGESAVVKALTGDAARAASTLRLTVGPTTTEQELDYVVTVLVDHCQHMRQFKNTANIDSEAK